jgi:hypothetical protein
MHQSVDVNAKSHVSADAIPNASLHRLFVLFVHSLYCYRHHHHRDDRITTPRFT